MKEVRLIGLATSRMKIIFAIIHGYGMRKQNCPCFFCSHAYGQSFVQNVAQRGPNFFVVSCKVMVIFLPGTSTRGCLTALLSSLLTAFSAMVFGFLGLITTALNL